MADKSCEHHSYYVGPGRDPVCMTCGARKPPECDPAAPAHAFDNADLYSCEREPESINAESPEEAIIEHLEHAGDVCALTIYGFARMAVPERYVAAETERLAETITERWTEFWELGNWEESTEVPECVAQKLREACELMDKHAVVWCCERVGERKYSEEEVAKIAGKSG